MYIRQIAGCNSRFFEIYYTFRRGSGWRRRGYESGESKEKFHAHLINTKGEEVGEGRRREESRHQLKKLKLKRGVGPST